MTESLSSDYMAFKATSEAFVNPRMRKTKWWRPLALAARANASDNPRWHEAMNGPDRAGYWKALKVEITTLTKLKAWKVIPITSENEHS